MTRLALALLLTATAATGALASGRLVEGPATAIDGDTIRVAGRPVRLAGIDAPELRQPCRLRGRPFRCGEAARDALRRFLAGGPVACRIAGRGYYGRLVGRCRVRGADLGASMVASGWAFDAPRYRPRYVAEEAEARAARRGLFADGIAVEKPWRWRRRQR